MGTFVILPIFNAYSDLAICLDSLWRHGDAATGVILINDASTDPRVDALLRRWRERAPAHWEFLSNAKNQGFVATVNRGMAACDGDVVLLNSDTQLTSPWLERIHACAASDQRIATITPFTNNGEIASWPQLCRAAPWPRDAELIANVFRQHGRPQYPDLPTAVGFCMWIRRQALDALGYFDSQAFGLGYGEENDFSQRALRAGWRNVLCDDAYVAHRGGASFLPLGLKPNPTALEEVQRRHPDYLNQVMAFIRQDPLKARREALIAGFSREQQHQLGLADL